MASAARKEKSRAARTARIKAARVAGKSDGQPEAKPAPPAGHRPLSDEERVLVRVNVIRGTAEFMWKYRSQLHKAGAVDFDLPAGQRLAPWLQVVFETLKLRPRHWRVVAMPLASLKGGMRFRVFWNYWGKCRRERSRPRSN
jgi:hypothetical protein